MQCNGMCYSWAYKDGYIYALAYGDGGMDMDIDKKCLSNNECSVMECATPGLTRMVTFKK